MRKVSMLAAMVAGVCGFGGVGLGQSAPFVYQGRLGVSSGTLAGTYDMRFRLYTDGVVGAPDTQVGPSLTFAGVSGVAVNSEGLFTARLEFFADSYLGFTGRWLQIEVKRPADATYTVLTPRQELTPTPYATSATGAVFAQEAEVAQRLQLPTQMTGVSGSDAEATFSIINSRATGGGGIFGSGAYWGVFGFGGDFSSYPAIPLPIGVQGVSDGYGVAGTSGPGVGVYGTAGAGTGGLFETRDIPSATGTAFIVRNNSAVGRAAIIEQNVASVSTPALEVRNSSTVGAAYGVYSGMSSTTPGAFSAAVRAQNMGTGGNGIGLHASHAGSGWSVYSTVGDGGIAVYGSGGGTTGYAGFFNGRVLASSLNVTGTLTKGSGTFRIDHPLDPENMYLSHSFVESPEMMNIYNGMVTTDGEGYAEVKLPHYFEALNMEYRYQLTVIDEKDSDEFVQAKVVKAIEGNRFRIRTSVGSTAVSWQVTGVRNDAFARQHRVVVEEEKSATEKGKYLHPVEFGLPASRGIDAVMPRPVEPAGQESGRD
ncbi:MAG: hypothetical protein AB7Q00_10735 [Phycisphaerales bacterium]